MSVRIIGVGELAVVRHKNEFIRTIGLGSCIGLTIYDRQTGVVGMVHVALPDSSVNPRLAEKLPGYFADTGFCALLKAMVAVGATNYQAYVIKLAGGACVMDSNRVFNIGERNFEALKNQVALKRLEIRTLDVGGSVSRSVEIHAGDGRVLVSKPAKEPFEL
jgi:chemotaxis protein CheD